jgi:hypothetical protein
MRIEQLLENLKSIEAISVEECIDYCVDCNKIVIHNQLIQHLKQGHMVIHQCFENNGVSHWIDCINWLIKKGYLKNE